MLICLNGHKKEIPSGTTIQQLIEMFQLERKSIVCELNRKVLDRNVFPQTLLREDDTVEIMHFVGGG